MQENQLPTEFRERLKILFPDSFEEVLETFNQRRPTTFRVNTLKGLENKIIEKLNQLGFSFTTSLVPGGYVLTNKTQRELTDTEIYNSGEIYIQGLSSMIPPLLLEAKENETILDVCAAPGSKTTQIAAYMNNTGQIIANDMSKVRLYKLAANLKTLAVTNTTTMHMKGQDLWRKFPEVFDRVLADVPCSLEGRFVLSEPKSYQNWSVKKIKILAEHQKHILRSAISCTKKGGTVIYSTCTLAPEENEGVVNWILKKMPHVRLVEITDLKVPHSSGILEWSGEVYDPEVKKCVRVVPNETMEAFFLARFVV